MALDSTIAGASANSYVSAADAETFFELRTHAESWVSATDETKEASLVEATRVIDFSFEFLGTISTQDQALRWPRSSVYDQDNRLYDSAELPKILTDAICDFALYLVQSDLLANDSADLIDELEIGPIRLDFDKAREKNLIPDTVTDQLNLLSVTKLNSRYGPFSMPVNRT